MSSLYHYKVLEAAPPTLRLRVWVTNPDVLAWGAKTIPKKTRDPAGTPFFATLLLLEQCQPEDALSVRLEALKARVRKSYEWETALRQKRGLPPDGDAETFVSRALELLWSELGQEAIAATQVENIAHLKAPKAAYADALTPAEAAKRAAYWAAWSAWDQQSDPPENLTRFELVITLKAPEWCPAKLPSGIVGTTAYARY